MVDSSTRVVNITEAKAQLSRLVDEAASGNRVVIGKAGKPVEVFQAHAADVEVLPACDRMSVVRAFAEQFTPYTTLSFTT